MSCDCRACINHRKLMARHFCAACKERITTNYMVKDTVWHEADLSPREFCCLRCLPGQLGRSLVLEDFDHETKANREIVFGYNMGLLITKGDS